MTGLRRPLRVRAVRKKPREIERFPVARQIDTHSSRSENIQPRAINGCKKFLNYSNSPSYKSTIPHRPRQARCGLFPAKKIPPCGGISGSVDKSCRPVSVSALLAALTALVLLLLARLLTAALLLLLLTGLLALLTLLTLLTLLALVLVLIHCGSLLLNGSPTGPSPSRSVGNPKKPGIGIDFMMEHAFATTSPCIAATVRCHAVAAPGSRC
jgi:hypothetical protein